MSMTLLCAPRYMCGCMHCKPLPQARACGIGKAVLTWCACMQLSLIVERMQQNGRALLLKTGLPYNAVHAISFMLHKLLT